MIDSVYIVKDTVSQLQLLATRQSAAITSIYESSKQLSTICLSIMGASIAYIFSNSYQKPASRKARFWFLILVPTWVVFFVSLYYALSIDTWKDTAIHFQSAKATDKILAAIRSDYVHQLYSFFVAICILGFSLVLYLAWWIHEGEPEKPIPIINEKEMD